MAGGFLPVVAPASVYWLDNDYYKTDEEFVFALADALHTEYRAIVDSGLLLQVDDAVLVHEYDSILSRGGSVDDYRRWAQVRIDALKHALKRIPEERVRYHICWGSWHGPHTYDPPLSEVVGFVLQVPARYYAIEQVILRCLDDDPRRRPASPLNVAMALPGGDPVAWRRWSQRTDFRPRHHELGSGR